MANRRFPGVPCIALLASVLLAVAACLGPPVTQERAIGPFQVVSASTGVTVNVRIVAGATPSVTVRAPEKVLDEVTTEVDGDRLNVNVGGMSAGSVTVDVTTPSLVAVSASSSATVVVDGVTGPRFDVSVSSQAKVEASGTADALALDVSSQAEATLGGLTAGSATVSLSSQARGEIRATGAVSGNVTSQATLAVLGSPTSVNVTTSSGGTVARD